VAVLSFFLSFFLSSSSSSSSFFFCFVLEILVPAYQNTRRHIAEESKLNVLVSLTSVVSKQECTYLLGGGDIDWFKF